MSFYIILIACAGLLYYLYRPKRIAVYLGSFDPPHLGHREVIAAALKAGCERVIVLPNMLHASKTHRMGLRYRVEMCRRFFQHPAVIVHDAPADKVLAKLHKDNKICALIGSDAALKLLHGGKAHYVQYVHMWLVMQRPEDKWPKVASLCGKPIVKVVISQFSTQQSSTNMRSLYATGSFDASLHKQNMYQAVAIAATLDPRFGVGVCDIPSPAGGSEHSSTFMHNDNVVVKVFHDRSRAQLEYDNAQMLTEMGLPCVKVTMLAAEKGPAILITPCKHGFVCLETLLHKGGEVARYALANVAVTLKQLHKSGVMHGDATARNVLFNPATGQVQWIDFLKAKYHGNPLREMYQFISGLHYYKVPNAAMWSRVFIDIYDPVATKAELDEARKQWPLLA